MAETRLDKLKETIDDKQAKIGDRIHALLLLLRSRKAKEENHEDQSPNGKELVEMEVATESIETEHGKEEVIPQFQVPVSKLEHSLQIQNESPNVCENSQDVVGCDELCEHQRSILQVSHVKEMEEFPYQSANGNGKNGAHQLFDQMPSKEKRIKHIKGWKFKFKPTSKRSKLMDHMFSFVEEIVLLNKDPKETIWDSVKKDFKETMAACGKKIFDRFKIVDETSKPAVYDGTIQIRVWDCGGSLLECVWWRRLEHYQRHGHEMQALEAENKSPETLGDHPFAPIKPYQSYAHPCLKCEAEMTIPLAKDTQNWIVNAWFKIQIKRCGETARQICFFTDQMSKPRVLAKQILVKEYDIGLDNVEAGSKEHSHESFGSKGLVYDGCVILGMNFAGFRRGKTVVLATSQKMQRIDLFSFCCSCKNQVLVAIHTEIEENLEFKQLLAAVERFSQEVIGELAKRVVIEQKIEGGLICGDVKFHLKHKWRFRLLQSFLRLILLALINLWFSKAYELSGLLKDSSNGGAESFPILHVATEQPLLWLHKNSENYLIVSEFAKKKQIVDREMSPLIAVLETVTKRMIGSHVMIAFVFIETAISYYQCIEHNLFSTMLFRLQSKKKQRKGHKSWMFKYKFDEEDQGLLQSSTGWTQEEPAVIRFLLRRHLHLHLDCEEPELAGQKRNHGVSIRLHSKQKQRKCSKCWMFKFRKKKIDHWLGYNLIVAYLENKKTWTKLRVRKHDNLTWKEDASDESRSRSSRCIMKLGDATITCKNLLEKSYDKNLEIVAWSKKPGRSEFICEVDDFGDQEASKFCKFVVAFTDLSTVAKTQDLGFLHVLHKDAV